jgi:phosphoribosylglycinamide formyltransferase-1
MKHIAIFASGAGSNAQKIIDYFLNHSSIKVALIICNKPGALVIDRAKKSNVPVEVLPKKEFEDQIKVLHLLANYQIDWIVLAGFLLLIPKYLIHAFPEKIVNIHPALLPKFGGAGMYGMKVHEAILKEKETETGITIHFVDERYDEGKIIFQAKCQIDKTDSPNDIAEKVHHLEHLHYPAIIEKVVLG